MLGMTQPGPVQNLPPAGMSQVLVHYEYHDTFLLFFYSYEHPNLF